MNSDDVSVIAYSPFVREFTYLIIESLKDKSVNVEEMNIIHTDLVPKFSEKIIQRSFHQTVPHQINFHKRPEPMRKPLMMQPQKPQIIRPEQIPIPVFPEEILKEIIRGYGKIDLLLNDPSVSIIECPGPGKELVIARIGQRQFTKIVLTNEEIREVLEVIADRAKIPIMEGVFRAAVDNFIINAIISEIVGSKFVIRKQFPNYEREE